VLGIDTQGPNASVVDGPLDHSAS